MLCASITNSIGTKIQCDECLYIEKEVKMSEMKIRRSPCSVVRHQQDQLNQQLRFDYRKVPALLVSMYSEDYEYE
jgi:hypothetical protein